MSSIKQNRDLEFPPESIHGIYGVNYYFQAENNTMQRLQFCLLYTSDAADEL